MSLNTHYENPLVFPAYYQPVEVGLALSLLRHHTAREGEAVLRYFVEDEAKAKGILRKVLGWIEATT